MDFGRLQTDKTRVDPEIEKYQFHPRHGCLNPLLPLVCRLLWNMPALLKAGGGDKRAPRGAAL